MIKELEKLQQKVIVLLKTLIATPSFSKEEGKSASLILEFLTENSVLANQHLNNIWSKNKYFDSTKPTILLNSHHDTVKPNKGYTQDPFTPLEEEGKLFGLGSNDSGGSLVSLIAVYCHFYNQKNMKYNIVLAATAEEEISGINGIESLLKNENFITSIQDDTSLLFANWAAIVGEPTQMNMAVAEKGLMVLDGEAFGKAGHAGHDSGINALYIASKDIEWFKSYQFEKKSTLLGSVKMSVTVIETENKSHNIIPSTCRFVVDCRINEFYSFEEILKIINQHVQSKIKPRSTRLRSTIIDQTHPLVKAGKKLGLVSYGSPTTSDKALLPFSALKLGPGDSARSHSADEFIFLDEIKRGIDLYIQLLNLLV